MALAQKQFFRRSRITIVTGSGEVLKQIIGYESRNESRGGLRVSFRIERQLTSIGDKATVQIYNMEPVFRAQLAQRSIYLVTQDPVKYLQISAGYEGVSGVGALFNGTIIKVVNRKEGPDWITEIEASAALAQMLANRINKTWDTVSSYKTIVDELLTFSNLGRAFYSPDALTKILKKETKSHSVSGSAYVEISNILKSIGLTLTLDVNKISIVIPGAPKDSAFALNITEDTGLLGTPHLTDIGVEFRTLLDHRISPGRLVRVVSRTLDESTVGLKTDFTVWTVTVVGDTHTNDWFCDVKGQFHPALVAIKELISSPRPIVPLENQNIPTGIPLL